MTIAVTRAGDKGYMDQSDFLFIVDRYKELIKYKGYQVAPAELEALILRHPDVAEAAVVGIPDTNAGQLPRAYIVGKSNRTVVPSEIAQFLAGIHGTSWQHTHFVQACVIGPNWLMGIGARGGANPQNLIFKVQDLPMPPKSQLSLSTSSCLPPPPKKKKKSLQRA